MRRMKGILNKLARSVAAGLVLATAPLCATRAADLMRARVWAGPDYTRIVLDMSGPLDYKTAQTGTQLVVDLGASRLADGFSDPTAQGLLHGMSHVSEDNRLKLIASVSPASRLKSFVLKPATGSDYRLVLDLYPAQRGAVAKVPSVSADARSVVASVAVSPTGDALDEPRREPVRSRVGRGHSSLVVTQQAAAMLNGQRKVVVAIDAGHGGKDQGAHGPGGTLEKNVTLAVARDLANLINRQPGMKAVLTRDGDYFIPLKQRYQIARENNADLFVAIHADSYTSDDARGSSVWVLSPRGKTNEAARWLADRENRADLIGGTTLDDKDDGLAKVLLDLQQGWAMQASDVVAGNVLKALAQLGPTHRGYVERANFVVLRSPDVPSILVETAFISNPAEERKLRDPAHQNQLADAVMDGVKNYFESTPPQGTWFAAQAARHSGVELASEDHSGRIEAASAVKPAAGVLADSRASAAADANVRDLHRVGRGESLRSIARQYGISIGALKSANRIDADTVRAGTLLTIPTG
jgi:N-acetylmuramoyl-L-alanine amidase